MVFVGRETEVKGASFVVRRNGGLNTVRGNEGYVILCFYCHSKISVLRWVTRVCGRVEDPVVSSPRIP